jgi:hypothetical protein
MFHPRAPVWSSGMPHTEHLNFKLLEEQQLPAHLICTHVCTFVSSFTCLKCPGREPLNLWTSNASAYSHRQASCATTTKATLRTLARLNVPASLSVQGV